MRTLNSKDPGNKVHFKIPSVLDNHFASAKCNMTPIEAKRMMLMLDQVKLT